MRTICGKILQSEKKDHRHSRRIGGPRYVCMKSPDHEGDHGEWEWMTQAEHGDYLNGVKQKSDHC